MTDLRFNGAELRLLSTLLKHECVSVIWDINAFYFNTYSCTYKLECYDVHPEGSDYKYDEIFYCRFERLAETMSFNDSNPDYWYKTIATDTQIRSVEIIETGHCFPEDVLTDTEANGNGINLVSLGLLIKTDTGSIPAFLLPSNHGFMWLEEYRMYEADEVEALLQSHIKIYRRKPIYPQALGGAE